MNDRYSAVFIDLLPQVILLEILPSYKLFVLDIPVSSKSAGQPVVEKCCAAELMFGLNLLELRLGQAEQK